MPRKSDDPFGVEWIREMTMAARVPQMLASDFEQTPLQSPTIDRVVLAHRSSRENKFIAEGWRNWAASFEQCFQVSFGCLLKAEDRLAPVSSMRVTPGQKAGFGNPHPVFIAARLNLGNRDYHPRE